MASKQRPVSLNLLRPHPTVDHLVRYLGTWSGSDKAFMAAQYSSMLLIPLLRRGGKSKAADGLSKLSGKIADARILCVWLCPSHLTT
jgi:histidine ammonia-lyase